MLLVTCCVSGHRTHMNTTEIATGTPSRALLQSEFSVHRSVRRGMSAARIVHISATYLLLGDASRHDRTHPFRRACPFGVPARAPPSMTKTMESTMTTQLDAAFPVHTRLTSTAPEGVIPQPRSAEVDLLAPATVPITRGVPAPRTPVAPSRSVEEVDALWEEYKAAPSARAREGLILHYAPLVSARRRPRRACACRAPSSRPTWSPTGCSASSTRSRSTRPTAR